MKSMDKQVEIAMSLSLIKQRLVSIFKKAGEPHFELVAKTIVENLETTEMGLSQLLLSFMGLEETTTWVEGDEALVHSDVIRSWDYEKELTREAGLLYKDHLKGKITCIDFRKKNPIRFEFQGISSATKKEVRAITVMVKLTDLKTDESLKLVRPDIADLL